MKNMRNWCFYHGAWYSDYIRCNCDGLGQFSKAAAEREGRKTSFKENNIKYFGSLEKWQAALELSKVIDWKDFTKDVACL